MSVDIGSIGDPSDKQRRFRRSKWRVRQTQVTGPRSDGDGDVTIV